ncbi:hypothetical protein PRNP1_010456 [Phytophthora ramorum]
MMQLSLVCAVVGEVGDAFPVPIDAGLSVGRLKDAIKAENPKTMQCDVKDARLFLAKQGSTWLDMAGVASVALDEHGTPQGFEPTLFLKNAKYFRESFQPGEGEVHVLSSKSGQSQADRLRRTFVKDVNDTEHFTARRYWEQIIDSE